MKGIEGQESSIERTQKKKKIHTLPIFRGCEILQLRKQRKHPQKNAPRRNQLGHYAIIKFPLTPESAVKKREDILEVKAHQLQIKQAVKKLYDIDMTKVSPLMVPDEEKKACVWLTLD
ncbi:60S ribosomal protein L23a-like [Sorex fumeus]|uniref:60S ribosomal protein L23a-like n=1 Tax=Sorex fumeus TaxID=62283 RepID=UPI0024ACC208|nr:60S ribosomal protein L23a-like [Sorex fumeus]